MSDDNSMMKMYQAQAMFVEKVVELEKKDAELEQKKGEIEKLQRTVDKQTREIEEITSALERVREENASLRHQIDKQGSNQGTCSKLQSSYEVRLTKGVTAKLGEMKGTLERMLEQMNQLEVETGIATGERSPLEFLDIGKGNYHPVLLLGWDDDQNYNYYFNGNKSHKLSLKLPGNMSSYGVACVKNEIYVVGGVALGEYDIYDCTKFCYKLEQDGTWKRMADMAQKRGDIENTTVVYQDEIWIIGGSNTNDGSLKTVEQYDPNFDRWFQMPELNCARQEAAATIFKGKIYISGGLMASRGSTNRLKSVEVFDFELQKWILFCDMPVAVSGHSMISLSSGIAVLGGRIISVYSNQIWKLNPEDPGKEWIQLPSFNKNRATFGAFQSKTSKNIVIFGGQATTKNGNNKMDSVEIFDGISWTEGENLPEVIPHMSCIELTPPLEERLLQQFL